MPHSGKSKFCGNLGSLLLTVRPYTITHSSFSKPQFPHHNACPGDLLWALGAKKSTRCHFLGESPWCHRECHASSSFTMSVSWAHVPSLQHSPESWIVRIFIITGFLPASCPEQEQGCSTQLKPCLLFYTYRQHLWPFLAHNRHLINRYWRNELANPKAAGVGAEPQSGAQSVCL